MEVIFSVKNGIHITKDNREMNCLNCELKVHFTKDDCSNGELKDLVQTWKDFKQFALDEEMKISLDDIVKTDNGIKIKDFSIPWNIQFFINQLIHRGYIN